MIETIEFKELSHCLTFVGVASEVQESSPLGESQPQFVGCFIKLGRIQGSFQDLEGQIKLPLERKLSVVHGESRNLRQPGWGHLGEALDLQVVLIGQPGERLLKLEVGRSMGDREKVIDLSCLEGNRGEITLGNEDPSSVLYNEGILIINFQAKRDDLGGCLAGRENEGDVLLLEFVQGRAGGRLVLATVVRARSVQVGHYDLTRGA